MRDLRALKEAILLTAEYYGRSISPQVLAMYAEDLSDLSEQDVIDAYVRYRRNPQNRTFPLPAQIRSIIDPEVTPDDEAREAAARVLEAITRFGWPNESGARKFVGELGWRIVTRYGGWVAVCQLETHQVGSFMAQARDLARATIARAKAGLDDEPPRIPEAQNQERLQNILSNTLKVLK